MIVLASRESSVDRVMCAPRGVGDRFRAPVGGTRAWPKISYLPATTRVADAPNRAGITMRCSRAGRDVAAQARRGIPVAGATVGVPGRPARIDAVVGEQLGLRLSIERATVVAVRAGAHPLLADLYAQRLAFKPVLGPGQRVQRIALVHVGGDRHPGRRSALAVEIDLLDDADRLAVGIENRAPDEGVEQGSSHDHSSRSEEHTSELQSRENLVCRLLLE